MCNADKRWTENVCGNKDAIRGNECGFCAWGGVRPGGVEGFLFGGSIGFGGIEEEEGVLPSRFAARDEMNCLPSQLRSLGASDGVEDVAGRR
jgi:hypothetical protein